MTKILWFINTPFKGFDSGKHMFGGRGGWLSNLADLVRDEYQLSLASVSPHGQQRSEQSGIVSYSIRPPYWKARLVANSLFDLHFSKEFTVRQLISVIDKSRPDLIHIHGTEKGYIELLRFQDRISAPILVSIQGIMSSVSRFFPGTYDRRALSNRRKGYGGKLASVFLKSYLSEWANATSRAKREQRLLPLARYVDGRTDYDHGYTRCIAPNATYFHIDRLLRKAFYSTTWKGPFSKPRHVHTTMSDSLSKGFSLIAETAIIISSILPGFQWRIAGLTPMSSSVIFTKRQFGRRYPDKAIRLLGNLDQEQLAEHLSLAPAYVMTSFTENSPNALAEAQISGTPVIATDVGGTSSYIRHQHDGILVPPGDPYALAGAVFRIFDDPALAASLSGNGTATARIRHAPERVRNQLQHAYRCVLSSANG
ncbi:MAG: glycosyltransferase family 4 protein [Planctomycetota bacterium]